ncbi:MAG: hypothetical protein R6V77_01450 [Candidatus Cloacimonadaceae bacterium]
MVQKVDSQYLSEVGEKPGIVLFNSEIDLLYVTETVNLKRTIKQLENLKEEDAEVHELFNQAETLQPFAYKTGTDALIQKNLLLQKHNPEFNRRINLWKNYVYLALNPAEFPFVKITEYTDEEWFYIGPFRSRFFLIDQLDLMNKLLKLPYCEVKFGPCDKQFAGRCRGWCELIKTELAQDPEGEKSKPHLEKLDALLKEAFVHPDNSLLDMILAEKKKYDDDLQFAKADLLSPQIDILKRYKEWLIFLYKIKNLNYVTDKTAVKNGQLVKYKADGKEHSMPFHKIKYRANEVLALNKNLVDEARILYQERI